MPLPRKERNMWVPLNDGTLQDLIGAYLTSISVLKDTEEVLKMNIGEPDKKGIRKISFMFIEEQKAKTLVHT